MSFVNCSRRKKTKDVTKLPKAEYNEHKRELERQREETKKDTKQIQKHWLMRAWK